jgi:glucosamine kinase
MAFYLGIDGGGTKTKFLLGDEHQLLAEATAAGSNILRSGEEAVRAALHAGVEEVRTNAGIAAAEIRRAVAGIAGSSNDAVRASLEGVLREKISGEIVIVGDMVIAHHAALDGAPGVLVNAGTGSIAYGRNAKNETARAGGWGFAISDEGSGHWIGRVAAAAAMRSFDAGVNEAFLHRLTAAVGAERPEELAQFANSTANPDFAKVFPAVVSLADLGDQNAQEILKHAGEELALLADTVLARLFAADESVSNAATGGVFRASPLVFESFRGALRAHHPSSTVSLSSADPAMGALLLARQGL